MSEVFVYVEGPSDQLGMRVLFAEVIEIARQNGKTVDFSDVPWILKRSRCQDLVNKCQQNFKPFVEDLFKVLGVEPS